MQVLYNLPNALPKYLWRLKDTLEKIFTMIGIAAVAIPVG